MRRRGFITLLSGAAAAWPLAARAQQGERRRIAVWMGRANDAEGRRLGSALRAALQSLGWVNGRNAPGGIITGFISNEPTLGSKWPGLLKEIAPTVKRVAFLFNPDTASYAEPFLRQAETAAPASGLQVTPAPIRSDPEVERIVARLASAPDGGLIVMPDAFTNTHSARILELNAQPRLPAIYAYRFLAAGGGLIAYGVDLADSLRAAASYVDRILRGEKPANLPVQVPARFSLVPQRRSVSPCLTSCSR